MKPKHFALTFLFILATASFLQAQEDYSPILPGKKVLFFNDNNQQDQYQGLKYHFDKVEGGDSISIVLLAANNAHIPTLITLQASPLVI